MGKTTSFLIILVILISCKSQQLKADKAAKEFCDCLKANANSSKDSALKRCNEYINNNYRLLKIYFETRDTSINDLYDRSTIDSVFDFLNRFRRKVDSCNPPFWFKSQDDPISF